MTKPDELYHDTADRIQTGAVPGTEVQPHEELHLRVTTLEAKANNHQQEIESLHKAIAGLSDHMNKVFAELGLS